MVITSILSTKILATYLPSQEFGYVVLIELVAMFLRMVSSFSIGISAIRSLSGEEPEKQKIIVDTVIIFQVVTLIVVSVLFNLTKPYVYKLFGEEPAVNLTYLILLFTLMVAYRTILKQMLQGFQKFKEMALIEVIASLVNVLLLAIFLIGLDLGMVGAVFARLLSMVIVCILFYLNLPTPKGFSFQFDTLSQLLNFSWPLYINDILTYVFNTFGIFTVATLMTPADVALLAIAQKIPNNIRRFYESFRTVYFPNLSTLVGTGDYPRAEKLANTTLRMVAFFMTSATALVYVFEKEIILLFFSEQYLNIGPILILSMFSLSIALLGNVLGNTTIAAGNSKAPPISNIFNTTFTIAGNLTLVPPFGIPGAVLASMIGRLVTTPVNIWFLRRTEINPKVREMVKPLVLSSVMLGVAWWFGPDSWKDRLPYFLGFIVASFVLSIVRISDIRLLVSIISKGKYAMPKQAIPEFSTDVNDRLVYFVQATEQDVSFTRRSKTPGGFRRRY
jgi:PST family polysaccharide transporter